MLIMCLVTMVKNVLQCMKTLAVCVGRTIFILFCKILQRVG